MNSTDFHNCMVKNREVYAKEQARLEHIYEQEKAKYSNTYTPPVTISQNTSNFKGGYYQPPQQINNSNIEARLDRIEARIDKLYEIFGCKEYKYNGLFVVAPENASINASTAFTLTDDQFKMLMKQLMND